MWKIDNNVYKVKSLDARCQTEINYWPKNAKKNPKLEIGRKLNKFRGI